MMNKMSSSLLQLPLSTSRSSGPSGGSSAGTIIRGGRDGGGRGKVRRQHKQDAIEIVSKNGLMLEYISRPLTRDKDVIMTAIQQNGGAYQFVAFDMKDNIEILMTAIQNDLNNTMPLQFASPKLRKNKNVVMTAVTYNGLQLQFVDMNLDRDIVMAAVQNTGLALKYASKPLRNDKAIVMEAVRTNGLALQFASDRLKSDRDVVRAAISDRRNGGGIAILEQASDTLLADKEFALELCQQDGYALQYFSEWIKDDKDVVLAAVKQNWRSLACAGDIAKGDKDIILEAASKNIKAVEHASLELRKSDKDIARLAFELKWKTTKFSSDGGRTIDKQAALKEISHNHRAFQFAPETLRSDKDVVLAAVSLNPDMLKYALGGLNQDRDCWIAAGLWSEEQEKKKDSEYVIRITLSTKFSLEEKSSSSVNDFTRLLSANPFFRDGHFSIYSPNAFSKDTCDPKWTDMDWPCRGTFDTCRKDPYLKIGKPKLECCWRYSFRWHLDEARRTNGFMIQIVDLDGEPGLFEESLSEYKLGDGQQIETEMAEQVGTKIFRIYRPRTITGTGVQLLHNFRPDHINSLASILQDWYDGKCTDMTLHEILCEERYDQSTITK